jgi:hypothetical protein
LSQAIVTDSEFAIHHEAFRHVIEEYPRRDHNFHIADQDARLEVITHVYNYPDNLRTTHKGCNSVEIAGIMLNPDVSSPASAWSDMLMTYTR